MTLRMLTFVAAFTLTACGNSIEGNYVLARDLLASGDGATIYVLLERGSDVRHAGGLWSGDRIERRAESHELYAFDRTSRKLTLVSKGAPPPSGMSTDLVFKHIKPGIGADQLPFCDEPLTKCVEAAALRPYRLTDATALGQKIIDPRSSSAISWAGNTLVTAPFAAPTPTEVSGAREALLLNAVRSVYKVAVEHRDRELAAAAEPGRVDSETVPVDGPHKSQAALFARYRLARGKVIKASFSYGDESFDVIWGADSSCASDNASIAQHLSPCRAMSSGQLLILMITEARRHIPDPDRLGVTWGVMDSGEKARGVVTVGCNGRPAIAGKPRCDPEHGDMSCRASLPVLCAAPARVKQTAFSQADEGRSPPAIDQRLALSGLVRGFDLRSIEAGHEACRAALGADWQMAEYRPNSAGMRMSGAGRIGDKTRFWVAYGDVRGNCW
jgi:hypothetical protein